MAFGNKRRAFARITVLGIAGCTATVLGIRYFQPAHPALIAVAAPTAAEVEAGLYRCGFTPSSLCAAGATTNEVAAVVDHMVLELNNDPDLISGVETTLGTEKAEMDELARLVKSGRATQAQVGEYDEAVTAYNTALAARDNVLSGLETDLLGELAVDARNVMSEVIENGSWDAPIEFRTIERTESDWIRLREALANERIAADDPEVEPDPGDQTYLSTARANATVSLAITNLSENLTATQNAWSNALNE